MTRYAPLLCAAVICLAASRALAQDSAPAPATGPAAQTATYETPAHIALVEGAASLERDGRTDSAPASMPLLAGDRVRTQVGRVEVLFSDGSTLHLDHHTTVDFQSDEVIRLLSGRVRLNIPTTARHVAYRVDAPGAWVQIDYAGEYRMALLRGDEVELAVLRGAAELVNEDGRTALRAGERAFARVGAAPSLAYVFNSAAWDAFDRWSEARRDERLGISAQYLPEPVRAYASTFDRYGSWRYEPTYGHVWYPTVYTEWRPYYRGRWASLRPYGWTWIGHDPWAWPTHHYGRWGFSAGLWFWIPGRHWGPAWVSWAYAPGYVSWCPLGWNNRPVLSFININVYRGRHHYDPWRAWTVIPRRHFGSSVVHVNVVHGSAIHPRVRQAFVLRDRAPEITGYAVPRAATPIRRAGTGITGRAVPRGTVPTSGDIVTGGDDAGASRSGRAVGPFREQRPGVSTTGPGFPTPSRARRAPSSAGAPRSAEEIRTPARAVPGTSGGAVNPRRDSAPYEPSPARRAVPRDRDADDRPAAGRRGGAVMPRQEAAPYDPGPSRRAVPRDRDADDRPGPGPRGGAAMPRQEAAPYDPGPSRRAVPRDRDAGDRDRGAASAPSYTAPLADPRAPSAPDGYIRRRAVPRPDAARPMPRRGDGAVYAPREAAPYQPPSGYRVPQRPAEPYGRPSPSVMPDRPRAMPRSGDAPSAGYPRAPHVERSAPPSYGPAPSPRIERSAPPPSHGRPSAPRIERAAPPPSPGPRAVPRGGDGPPPAAAPAPPPQAQPARPRGGDDANGRAARRPRGN